MFRHQGCHASVFEENLSKQKLGKPFASCDVALFAASRWDNKVCVWWASELKTKPQHCCLFSKWPLNSYPKGRLCLLTAALIYSFWQAQYFGPWYLQKGGRKRASAFVSRVLGWKRWLIMSLCEVLKCCSLRLFVVMQKFFVLFPPPPFWCGFEGMHERLRSTMRDVSQPFTYDITFVKKYVYPRLFLRHPDWLAALKSLGTWIIHRPRGVRAQLCRRMFSGQCWKDWLVLHWQPTCLPAHFSFKFWPRVKMAASHTGRLEVNLTSLLGHRRLLLFSLCLSSHLFGACGRGKRNGELCLVLLCCNHSLQRVLCFSPSRWQTRGKMKPHLARISARQIQTRMISPPHLQCPSSSWAF